jgi:hypothetical protein
MPPASSIRAGLRSGAAVAALAGALLLAAPAEGATAPDDLGDGHLTDRAGVLTAAQESRLEDRLAGLAAKDDRPELYVVLVDDFADPSDAAAWADAVAERGNLAADQYLLAIATEGRALAISYDESGPLAERRVLEIEEAVGSGYLADEDWAGGVEYVAAEFDEVPPPWWIWVLGLAALALLIFVIVQFVLLGRRKAARALELRTLEGQKKRASISLVRADEALRTSEQELGFVTAEFGDEVTREFSAVLTEGRERLDRAFELQRRLEDATADSDADTRAWTDEILTLCGQIDRDLEARKRALADLRDLAKDATGTVERLTAARAEAEILVTGAEERIAALLRGATPADRLAGVADDPAEMREHLRHADQWLDRLRAAAERGRAGAIRTAVHEIERDLAEVRELHAAVAALGDAAPVPGATPGETELQRAAAAVRSAEASVAARSGRLTAPALATLRTARHELDLARSAADATTAAAHAATAAAMAEQAQRAATEVAAREAAPRSLSSAATDPDDLETGGKAVFGALTGGVAGLIAGFGALDGDAPSSGMGILLLSAVIGAVLGALSGALSREGGGSSSSSGWGGSSSRSSRGSSGRSSRSSGGGRSSRSGRSSRGGRRF